jgi:hypothetical protein
MQMIDLLDLVLVVAAGMAMAVVGMVAAAAAVVGDAIIL